jgi:6-pyruvoyltetrahydropterin/6-carboxytetrahydropterin synthase
MWSDFSMFEVSVEATFAAAHQLRNYKGKCENLHGHNYKVRVTVGGPTLNSTGLVADFGEVKAVLREVAGRLDHRYLNELEPFVESNPSAENIALYFYQEIDKGLRDGASEVPIRINEVIVWETETSSATYRP